MTSTPRKKTEVEANVKAYLVSGLAVVFILVGGLGVWATTTSIVGAVIGSGIVVVETNVKKVQHPTGGIVGEINVKNGDQVKAGDLLIRLDETLTRTNEQMISKQLDQLMMREARLKAERDGIESITVPAILARAGRWTPTSPRLSAASKACSHRGANQSWPAVAAQRTNCAVGAGS